MPWIKFQNMEEYVKMTMNTKYLSFSIQLTNLMVKNIRWTVISYSALWGIPCCYGLQRLFMLPETCSLDSILSQFSPIHTATIFPPSFRMAAVMEQLLLTMPASNKI